MRTTQKHLEFAMKALTANIPAPKGTKWGYSAWAPGDSYGTRYQLVQVNDVSGGEHQVGGVICGLGNFVDALRVATDALSGCVVRRRK